MEQETNMKRIAILLALSLAGCSSFTQPAVPAYDEAKAAEQMESFIKAHAALSNDTPGPLETRCAMVEKLQETDTTEFACASLVKKQNVVLEADCSRDMGCEATGYKVWDSNQNKFVEPNPALTEVAP